MGWFIHIITTHWFKDAYPLTIPVHPQRFLRRNRRNVCTLVEHVEPPLSMDIASGNFSIAIENCPCVCYVPII